MAEENVKKQSKVSFILVSVIVSCVLLLLIILFAVIGFGYYNGSLSIGVDAALAAHDEAVGDAQEQVYQMYYDTTYNYARDKYKVTNEAVISIGEVRELARLEVLKVSSIQYVVEERESNEANIEVWLAVPGYGVYTVNLEAGEYIVDSARKTVTIRVPEPILENVSIDYDRVEKLLFENDWLNDSYLVGEALGREHFSEGYAAIYNDLSTNPSYKESAEDSAKQLITALVTEINKDVEGLVVEVEFMR